MEPRKSSQGKIIHVNFAGNRASRPRRTYTATATGPRSWLRDLDIRAPWVLRLVAVVAILILSMLIL